MANSSLHTWKYDSDNEQSQAEYAAVLVSVEKNRNSGSIILTREWPDMDATAAEIFAFETAAVTGPAVDSLADTPSFEDPKADQATYKGIFYGHRPEIISQPGRAVTVRQVLTLPKNETESVVLNKAALKATWFESSNVKHDVYYYWDNTAAQYTTVVALWDVTGDEAGNSGEIVNIGRVSFNSDGSLDFIVEVVTEEVDFFSENLDLEADPVVPDEDLQDELTNSAYKTWEAPWGTAHFKAVTNALEANLNYDLAALETTHTNSVDIRKNANGLFDYSIRQTPRAAVSTIAADAMNFGDSAYTYKGMYGGGEKTFTVGISWKASAAAAGTYINAGISKIVIAGHGTNRTGIIESHGRFKATRVTFPA